MPVYQRRTRVAAPLERVWEFHSDISGLEALTPEWMNLEIVAVRTPEGTDDAAGLVAGTEIEMSMRPFGVGPRQQWVSRILDRQEGETTAWFRDDMVGGPFRKWVHTHRFAADGEETIIEDRVEYELPFGPLGDAAGLFGGVGFEPMFRERHKRTKAAVEDR
ncbi:MULTISPECIES: SRPBCC family protein [Haloferax]|uniref:Cyclase n=1 Tax=Haloferax marinum TaxID=2666143 RepID=A0A6A8G1Z4_9EURY|nr:MULTISPECIES: SRPBCC family protein [Haloferax]KAB1196089.1 SRPBCC family protein [Haloferax sp. CBA1150]MRW95070.1 cyclase [Haloferax marinum]